MNNISLLLFQVLLIILITFSYEDDFNPIPKGNGKLNARYNHNSEENNLFFIFLSFRHGARAPLYMINNKDMLGGEWLMKGDLTNNGRKQLYEIGLETREKYENFLSNDYDPKEIKIYSTNYDRTINSIQSLLLGLYNNVSYVNFTFTDFNISKNNNKDIDLEYINSIIPGVKLFEDNDNEKMYINNKIDTKFKFKRIFKNHFDCQFIRKQFHRTRKEKNKIINSIISKFIDNYYNIIIKEFKNVDREKIKTEKGFYKFCDVFLSNYYEKNEKVLNKFIKNGKNIKEIKNICDICLYNHFVYVRNGGYAANNAIISQSPTFKKIIDWMEVRSDQNNNFAVDYSEPKLVLYSGHDSTLFELQSILNKSFNIETEYTYFGSTQIYEVRKYQDVYYVEIYYNDRLKMNITFEEFKGRIRNHLISDKEIYNICYEKKEEKYLRYGRMIFAVILVVLIIILLSLINKINSKNMELNSMKVIQIA